jgi:hypothetical protein
VKRFLLGSICLLFILSIGAMALAQAASPAPSVTTVTAPVATPVAPSGFFAQLMAYKSQIGLAVYALLDLLVLMIPGLAGNGIVHQILIVAGKLANQNSATPPSSTNSTAA